MASNSGSVSPIEGEEHILPAHSRAPEISGMDGEQLSFHDAPNHELDPPRPTHSKTGLSWRTRLVGANRSTTVNITEVENGHGPTPPYEPIQDQETHFPALDEQQMRDLRGSFNPQSQLYRLLLKGFIKWLVTVAFCGALGGIMYYYSTDVAPMTDNDKRTFNFLVVGLSLALGMNLASSLKAMAIDLRWWILSLKKRDLREVDLILHLDSLTEVFKLAFHAPRLAPACFLWLLVNIGFQIGIALMGLCYSPDSSTDTALVFNGSVLIPDMSRIYTEAHSFTSKSDSVGDQQYTANNFGNIALSYYGATSDDIPTPDTLWAANSPIIFEGFDNNNDNTYWEYVFMDTNAVAFNDTTSTVAAPVIFTNRTVNVTWSCQSWLVTVGGNGSVSNLTILLDSDGSFKNIGIPYAGGSNQTTFITNPDVASDCGPGCSTVTALEASDTKPWWYECNITVGDTNNATLPEQLIGQPLATMAAAAIALQGHVVDAAEQSTGEQFQYYPATSEYGFPNGGDVDYMGSNIASFAIGVIATAAQWNPQLQVTGNQPETGSQLEVEWDLISIIFGLTVGIQFILFIISSVVANLVIVKDESYFATARLLRPIVDRLGPVGTHADGKEMCKLLDEKVVYSVKHPQKGILHHLDLGHQKRLRAFPRGDYD